MNLFKKLLTNAHINPSQLFVYLQDAQQETKRSDSSFYRCGYFFSDAFGLDLCWEEALELGKFIHSGRFKPSTVPAKNGTDLFKLHQGSIEMYWRNI